MVRTAYSVYPGFVAERTLCALRSTRRWRAKDAGEIHGVTVSNDDMRALGDAVSTLPLHPDVAPALDQLSSAGFRMVTLTNSSGGGGRDPLADARVAHHFEHRFTVAQVGSFKPSPATYQQVTDIVEERQDLARKADV